LSPSDKEANLLGAFTKAVADRTAIVVVEVAGQSESAAAALSALHQFLDHTTVDRLCQVLGLTPSGAVRLVDRLSDAGLVTRAPGTDGRTRDVSLTRRGRRVADKIRAARLAALQNVLAPLSDADASTLHALLARMMNGIVEEKDGGAWLCRLCDLQACRRPHGGCPTATAAAAKYGQPAAPVAGVGP
jgi:DNA-binding MarR family transcriptional regulator